MRTSMFAFAIAALVFVFTTASFSQDKTPAKTPKTDKQQVDKKIVIRKPQTMQNAGNVSEKKNDQNTEKAVEISPKKVNNDKTKKVNDKIVTSKTTDKKELKHHKKPETKKPN